MNLLITQLSLYVLILLLFLIKINLSKVIKKIESEEVAFITKSLGSENEKTVFVILVNSSNEDFKKIDSLLKEDFRRRLTVFLIGPSWLYQLKILAWRQHTVYHLDKSVWKGSLILLRSGSKIKKIHNVVEFLDN
ncbi:hypothetical protein ACFQ88_22475 [Paenibacillus sp. NPDC056579]|uniref:hypothetical protein n=1 Tax=Paenibacillus sp. NPDC056579 TaxID=3345871 RepID=UPI0036CBC020